MSVFAFVTGLESAAESIDIARRAKRRRQCIAWTMKAHIGLPLAADPCRREFAFELVGNGLFHRTERGFDIGKRFRGKVAKKRAGLIDARIGENHAQRGKDTGLRRNNYVW